MTILKGVWEELNRQTITADDTTIEFFPGGEAAADFDAVRITVLGLYTSATGQSGVVAQVRESGGSFLTTSGDYSRAYTGHFTPNSGDSSLQRLTRKSSCSAISAMESRRRGRW